MEITAIVTFLVVAGFVWGGFILLLVKALRRERSSAAEAGDAEA